MEFGEVPLERAEGAVLAHAILLGGQRIPKGRPVDAALLAAARAEGVTRLWVARAHPGDMPEAEAAAALGTAMAGEGVVAEPPVHGRVNLRATRDGLVLFDPGRLRAANLAGEEVGIATLPPFAPVTAGDLVSTVKIIPYAVGNGLVSCIAELVPRIEVCSFATGKRAILVRTLRDGEQAGDPPDKAAAKAEAVTRARLLRLGMALEVAPPVAHAIAAVADALASARADLLLVAGATATADRRDVIPAAILAAGGTVARVGMPVDPGNLLVLGRIGDTPVIGLPGCARSPKRNGLDLVLERLAAGFEVTSDIIAAMGTGGLLEESGRTVPWGWTG